MDEKLFHQLGSNNEYGSLGGKKVPMIRRMEIKEAIE